MIKAVGTSARLVDVSGRKRDSNLDASTCAKGGKVHPSIVASPNDE